MTRLARIVRLPNSAEDEVQPYWLTTDGLVADHEFYLDDGDFATIALAGPESVLCRWHDYPALAPRQAEAAARLDAAAASINGDALHIVACTADDGRVISATADNVYFGEALERLRAQDIEPDHVIPLGLLVPGSADAAIRVSFDGIAALRQGTTILPDDLVLARHFLGDRPVNQLSGSDLASALEHALLDPPINLRVGAFAKRDLARALDWGKTRLAIGLAIVGILFSLLLALASWAKVDRAIARENAKAVQLAQKVIPGVSSATEAATKIEQRLASKGGGSRSFTTLSAALWQALQRAESVSLRDMRYGSDRILAITLISPAVDPVNRVLIDLQQQGYKVTANPRQEANGITAVAVTVRAP
jgi:general secretion pathway protein L